MSTLIINAALVQFDDQDLLLEHASAKTSAGIDGLGERHNKRRVSTALKTIHVKPNLHIRAGF